MVDEPVGNAVVANDVPMQPVLRSRPHTMRGAGYIRLLPIAQPIAYCLLPIALLPIACSMVVEPVGNAVDDVPHHFGVSRPVAPSRVIDLLGPLLVSCSADFCRAGCKCRGIAEGVPGADALPDLCGDGGSAIVVLSGCPPDGIGG